MSVFSKENIKRRTRFGPLQAPLKSKSPLSSDRRSLAFKLFGTDKEAVWFNTEPGNEDFCNWMVFVSVASAAKEQNLAAFQYQSGIYFVTIKVNFNLIINFIHSIVIYFGKDVEI